MIYLITNRKLIKKDFLQVLEDSFRGGLDRLVIREKDLTYEELLSLSKEAKKLSDSFGRELIINGNIKVAKEVGADGVHLSYEKFMNEEISFKGLIGVSTHSLIQARNALANGASYVFVSHIFETDCKKGLEPKGLTFLKEIISKLGSEKVVALGGINKLNQIKLREVGTKHIAVMSEIMGSEDPFRASVDFKEYF